jgi:hypothetical protein
MIFFKNVQSKRNEINEQGKEKVNFPRKIAL